ncbi:MAG: class II fructose-bisphosphate aldolase [Syntrophales bacterium]|nr:class II fructose-bisphosphate aldolase [Syntrophales bacterium]
MIYVNLEELKDGIKGVIGVKEEGVDILDHAKLVRETVDNLVYTAVFSPEEEVKMAARWLIRRSAAASGILLSSIQDLYDAMGRGEVGGFTVPAINIRTLTYHVAQTIFHSIMKLEAGPVIFEIARSEIDYTRQRPSEYATCVLAAAIKANYRGPVFVQGDHFQVSANRYSKDSAAEVKAVKDLIWEAIEAGFYNIDIDTSTLVDLSQSTVKAQQRLNYTLAADFTVMIRDLEPNDITISVGGEIGEVGGKNSTVEELDAFMEGYREQLNQAGEDLKGISKISVQTGTTHGGVPLPDGTIAKVKLDFATLEDLSRAAREKYGLAGAVQHGASTLPPEAFDKFPAVGTAEVHLATGFQNIIYDSPHLPTDLKASIYRYLEEHHIGEKKEKDTPEQFIYKTRKKGFGPFKYEMWHMPEGNRQAIMDELEGQFTFIFEKLKIPGTRAVLDKYIKPVDVPVEVPRALA